MYKYDLSPRETEVLNLLVAGCSYHEIADKLFIFIATVKTHVIHIYQKTNVKNKFRLINNFAVYKKENSNPE
ncbi:MAG: helix-turn-helix transcriptional regulator [Spirochaetales bacterium]|nr:helix-turn-helix transcriptional regulator [Spirochaetales bacterium]